LLEPANDAPGPEVRVVDVSADAAVPVVEPQMERHADCPPGCGLDARDRRPRDRRLEVPGGASTPHHTIPGRIIVARLAVDLHAEIRARRTDTREEISSEEQIIVAGGRQPAARDETDLHAPRNVLRCGQRVESLRRRKIEGAQPGDEVESGRAVRRVRQRRNHPRGRWERPFACNEDRVLGGRGTLASKHAPKKPQLAGRAEPNHAADIPRFSTYAQRKKAVASACQRPHPVAALKAGVPRHPLKVGEERVTDADPPVAADWIALPVQPQGIGAAEEVIMRQRAAQPVPICEAALHSRFRVHAEAEDVLVAGHDGGWLTAPQPSVEHRRNLVDGFDLDSDAASLVGDRAHLRRREERLRAQEPLGLGPPKLSAWPPDLERHESPYDAFTGRGVVKAEAARNLAPDAQVSPERRPLGTDDDCTNRVAVARYGWRHRVRDDRSLQGGLGRSGQCEERVQ
jgi:hypothetical protein